MKANTYSINNIQKNNRYENEINYILKDLGGYLPFYHFVSLLLWENIIRITFVSTNILIDNLIGSLDCICWSAFCEYNYSLFFTEA